MLGCPMTMTIKVGSAFQGPTVLCVLILELFAESYTHMALRALQAKTGLSQTQPNKLTCFSKWTETPRASASVFDSFYSSSTQLGTTSGLITSFQRIQGGSRKDFPVFALARQKLEASQTDRWCPSSASQKSFCESLTYSTQGLLTLAPTPWDMPATKIHSLDWNPTWSP